MNEADAARVIEARVESEWSPPAPAVTVYYEEQPVDEDLAEYVVVEIRTSPTAQTHPSLPDYRNVGSVMGVIYVKRNTGTRRARALADSFASMWRSADKTPITLTDAQAGTLRFRASDISKIVPVGATLEVTVRVPFVRDVTLS